MRVDLLKNEYEIAYLDKYANQYVLSNFGANSDCVWGIWDDDKNIVGYCTLGFAEGVIPNVKYMDLLLSDVFILPQYRNKGYATILLREVFRQTYAPIYAVIFYDSLISFYSRFGFKDLGHGLLLRG